METRTALIFILSFTVSSIAAEEAVNMASDTSPATTTSPPAKTTAQDGILNFTIHTQNILYHLSSSDGNVLFAPVNLVSAMATLLLGAEGETKSEILELLGFAAGRNLTNKEENVHKVLGELLNKFVSSADEKNPAIKLLVANGIFVQKDAKIGKEFSDSARQIYKNDIVLVDYVSQGEAALKTINEWASSNTKGKINEIIQPPVRPNTQLIIASTLYFNGEWEQPFQANSSWQHFYTDDGIIQVKMMLNRGPAYLYNDSNKNFTALGLPYKGNTVIMYLIQPFKDQHLKDIIASITLADIHAIAANATLEKDVSYSVPYMELTENINVETALKQAGVKTVFDPTSANLSKIAKGVHVSDAIHKTNLHVTEAGSTGTAATTLDIETRFPESNSLTFNKPFTFFIFHKSSGLISFWGTVNIPIPNQKLR